MVSILHECASGNLKIKMDGKKMKFSFSRPNGEKYGSRFSEDELKNPAFDLVHLLTTKPNIEYVNDGDMFIAGFGVFPQNIGLDNVFMVSIPMQRTSVLSNNNLERQLNLLSERISKLEKRL